MAAIDQDGELDARRPAERADRIQRGAAGAAGEKNVVDDDDRAARRVAAASCDAR